MQTLLFLIVLFVIAGMAWIRYAPTDPDDWHIDPAEVSISDKRGYRLIGRDAPRFPGDPDTVLEAFVSVARASPGVWRLDGSVDEGMVTLVARTRWLGFRDYVTVKAVAEGPETKLALVSRARYAVGSDWGLNRDRLESWLAELERVLIEGG